MKYEARYGTDLVARARSVWGIRRKAKRWCKSKENRMMRQPKLENIRFYKVTFDAFGSPHTERIQVKP